VAGSAGTRVNSGSVDPVLDDHGRRLEFLFVMKSEKQKTFKLRTKNQQMALKKSFLMQNHGKKRRLRHGPLIKPIVSVIQRILLDPDTHTP